MTVKYPQMRLNLREASRDLGDEAFHGEVWSNPSMPTPDNRFSFREAVAYVVDDLDVPSPQSLVGDVLADQTELTIFDELSSALNAMLKRIGSNGTYAGASTTPEWEQARLAARKLASVLAK
jgi:hypothetical protein